MSRMGTTVIRMDTPEVISHHLSQVVGAAIKSAGESQRSVAAKTGIPLVTLSRRLTGRTSFTFAEVAAIAGVIGVSVVELVLRAERASSSTAA